MDDEEKVLEEESEEEPQKPAKPEYITVEEHQAKLKEQYIDWNKHFTEMGAKIKRLERDSEIPKPPPIDTAAFVQESIALENLKSKAPEDPTAYAPQIAAQQAKVDDLRRKQAIAVSQQKVQTENAEQRAKLESQIVEAGLDPEDDQFESVWDAFDFASAIDGNWPKAQRKLDRVLKKEKPVEAEKPKTETPSEDKIREDERLKVMKEHGLLVTDDGGPSASSASWAKFEEDYIAGKVPLEKYHERKMKEGR